MNRLLQRLQSCMQHLLKSRNNSQSPNTAVSRDIEKSNTLFYWHSKNHGESFILKPEASWHHWPLTRHPGMTRSKIKLGAVHLALQRAVPSGTNPVRVHDVETCMLESFTEVILYSHPYIGAKRQDLGRIDSCYVYKCYSDTK